MDAHALIGVQERQILGGLPGFSDIFPGSPTKSHSTSTSATSSSSSVSASDSVSSTSASLTTSSSTTSSSSTLPTLSTPEPTPSTPQDFSTTFSQSTQTVTSFPVDASSSASAAPVPTHTSFLQNKVLSGLVFALVGVVGLVVIVSLLTFFIRRKRTRRLVEDAVSFDPVKMGSGYHDALETGRAPQTSANVSYPRLSSSTGHASSNGNGPEIRQAAPFSDYAPPHPQMYKASNASLASYHSQQGYNNSQQQQAAYMQPFNWAAPPQSVDPYRGTSA